jgi:hypothetical protein
VFCKAFIAPMTKQPHHASTQLNQKLEQPTSYTPLQNTPKRNQS